MHQQHDGHGRKLLAEGSKAEIGAGIDFLQGVKIRNAIAAGENGVTILTHQHCRARGFGIDERREDAVNGGVRRGGKELAAGEKKDERATSSR
jgi:hypothetical protein